MAGTPPCWTERAAEQIADMGTVELEMFEMYTSGPMAAEYAHTDVWRALNAIGVDVGYEAVKRHRNGYCQCKKKGQS